MHTTDTLASPAPERVEPRLVKAAVAGLGMAVPHRSVANAPIEARLGVGAGWIEARTGIANRHVAAEDETLADLAAAASRSALEDARVAAADVDTVLVATGSADALYPNAAPLVADAIGAVGAHAVDLGAACTGFVSGLTLGASLVEAERASNVLVVGAEVMTRVIDHRDRSTAGLFADGAGAALVAHSSNGGGIGPSVAGSDSAAGAELIYASHADRQVQMAGLDVYRHAVNRLSEATLGAVDAAGLTLADIDVFVYHQANRRILVAVAERLGLDRGRVIDCIRDYGNTSAATVPIALCVARQEGRLVPGARVLLAAFGAGFTWAGTVMEHAGD